MKAQFIATALSLFIVTIPVQAESNSSKKSLTLPQSVASVPAPHNRIDINKADAQALAGSFKGIGKKRAEAIIAYRDAHKGIKSLEELAEIKGFGQRFVDANRDKLKETYVIHEIS